MNRARSIGLYLLASATLAVAIYGSALWGGRMLAPLDIGPDLFVNFRYMNPTADGVPDNHHVIDQFTYDLPLQYTIYRAYHAGEIPWWDPYTFGGRPLLADAHVNGTDPVRLACYAVLPFELAYNWNLVIRGILTGLGMFLLLRTFGVNAVIAGVLAITYQFAGWFTLYWGHPWIQGSFLYFPYLWIVWMRSRRGDAWLAMSLGGLLCGLVFYAGNLQSHTYLVLFALSFLIATLIKEPKQFYRAFGIVALSGLIGALLASPVLANQLEFYLLNTRSADTAGACAWYYRFLSIPYALGSFYPWMFGTFRTLDVGHMVGMQGMGFQLFCGIGCTCLAFWGAWQLRREQGAMGLAICQSCILIAIFLAVVSTPLAGILYSRCSPLAGMGLIVLAALTAQAVIDRNVRLSGKLIKSLAIVVVTTSVLTSGLAWWAFPLIKARIERMAMEADKNNASLLSSPNLRKHQIDVFSQEVSLMNPETVITVVAMGFLAYALTRSGKGCLRKNLTLTLIVSALPVVMFHARFKPSHPMALWHQFKAGGPAQQEAKALLTGGLRLDESAMHKGEAIFIGATAAMYRVHVLQGYSALQPFYIDASPSVSALIPEDWRSDYSDYSAMRVENANPTPMFKRKGDSARLRVLATGGPAPVKICEETQNQLVIDASSLPENESLVRTDTYYPGWQLRSEGTKSVLAKQGACLSVIPWTKMTPDGMMKLEYTPRYLAITLPCLMISLLFVAGSLLKVLISSKRSEAGAARNLGQK